MIMLPKVTIIMPSLNVVDYIEECINSVTLQTLKDIEILCIDAGSTDGTLDILQKYADRDCRIKLIHSDRRSYGYQVNLGIRLAKGDYIAILETDDYISGTMYENLYNQATLYDLDYIKSDYIRVEQIEDEIFYSPVKIFSSDENRLYRKVISTLEMPELFWRDIHIWKGLYKREFLITNDVFLNESDGAAYQDYGFGLLLHTKAKRGMYVPEQYYYYRWGRIGASSGNKNILKYAYQEFERILEEGLIDPTKEQKYQIFYRIAIDFPSEYSRVLKMVNYDVNSEYLVPYYDWFKQVLQEARNQGNLLNEYGSESFWNGFNLLLESDKKYAEQIHFNDMEYQQKIEWVKTQKVVIFGAGAFGTMAYKLLRGLGIKVYAIIDNDSKKWGTYLKSCIIMSLDECVKKNEDVLFIIANSKYKEEINNQLLNCGIASEKIKYYEELL